MYRVLVCDDTAFMRMMLRDIAEELGYEVVAEASNGKEAVMQYSMHRPDLVTMDITMPEMDGIGALKKIKEMDRQAKVIMCSAMGQQQMVMEAMRNGATDFIVKPIQKERVALAFQRAIG
ncbi:MULTISPECIES: response regulator [unclassified Paenibacillus]|uniref:response regulator n=1 Tax=unclassified Paenibacillus TaxID=185978 RepID=UPI001C10C3AE|nr:MULTISPECIES: response regulator [unclassified Paenibacillus]MBU5445627.1 response regulator [Paenibacillus sp. MSJ-34]CAH0119456.1 Chemotaxis protein CheY [Paenibacillus sp. CECT 9249]